MNQSALYYLPGRGGKISTGLGEELRNRGFDVVGRETIGEFRDLSFQQQIDLISKDLTNSFWQEDSRIIAVSFGAYLLLHSLAQLPPFMGKILLLSPILGQFSDKSIGMGFIPPRANKLKELVDQNEFPVPATCEIHVGSEDWQSNPESVRAFAQPLGIGVNIIPNEGHQIDPQYIKALLDVWL